MKKFIRMKYEHFMIWFFDRLVKHFLKDPELNWYLEYVIWRERRKRYIRNIHSLEGENDGKNLVI